MKKIKIIAIIFFGVYLIGALVWSFIKMEQDYKIEKYYHLKRQICVECLRGIRSGTCPSVNPYDWQMKNITYQKAQPYAGFVKYNYDFENPSEKNIIENTQCDSLDLGLSKDTHIDDVYWVKYIPRKNFVKSFGKHWADPLMLIGLMAMGLMGFKM